MYRPQAYKHVSLCMFNAVWETSVRLGLPNYNLSEKKIDKFLTIFPGLQLLANPLSRSPLENFLGMRKILKLNVENSKKSHKHTDRIFCLIAILYNNEAK